MGVTGKHFVARREAIEGHYQRDAHLLAVRPMIAGIAALRERVGFGPTFEERARHVIEQRFVERTVRTSCPPAATTRTAVPAPSRATTRAPGTRRRTAASVRRGCPSSAPAPSAGRCHRQIGALARARRSAGGRTPAPRADAGAKENTQGPHNTPELAITRPKSLIRFTDLAQNKRQSDPRSANWARVPASSVAARAREQPEQEVHWYLADLVARQRRHDDERPRQKRRIHFPAETPQDLVRRKSRSND